MVAEEISLDTVAGYATQALADAMAWRFDTGLSIGPTDEMQQRAAEIVRAVLDISGNRFAVLLNGSEEDAKRLAFACGKNGDHTGEALQVIRRLVADGD